MRVLLDTNVLISALLSKSATIPLVIVEQALAGKYDLIISELTVMELLEKIASKSYLANRLAKTEVEGFIAALRDAAQMLPDPDVEIPARSRDRKDDYLIFHALNDHPDYLVTGDKDLLVLGQVAETMIVSPAQFLSILDELSG